MSHTFTAKNGTHFTYNPDMRGSLIIRPQAQALENVNISAADVLEFVAEIVARRKISEIEIQTPEQILGMEL